MLDHSADKEERGRLILLLLVSLALYLYPVWWGLPNGDATWAVDAITPLTPLSVAHKSFSSWNSGWFYFKYSIGHVLLLLAVYLPAVLVLMATGHLYGAMKVSYGSALSKGAVLVFALLGRLVSVAMATATIWLLYRITRRLFGRRAAFWSAAAAALSLGMIFYSHTTNLDIPCLFWTLVAWDAALGLQDALQWRGVLVFGGASGMALATKEQAIGFLIGLSAIIAIAQVVQWRRGTLRSIQIIGRLAGGVGMGVLIFLVASNAFYNPLGFYRRLQFITGTLPPDVANALVPRAAFLYPGTLPGLQAHWEMFRESCRAMAWSMSFGWWCFALCGLVIALRRAPMAVVWLVVPSVAYYFISLPALPQPPNVRYVLPMTIALSLAGGLTSALLWKRGRPGKALVLATLAYALASGVGVDYLMAHDPRYQAEAWLQHHTRPGTRIEVYQKASFLPRFPDWLTVVEPKFRDISSAGFAQRAPDLVLLNMAELKHIVSRYDKSQPRMVAPPENAAFLQSLLRGELGYREVASFSASWPLLPENIIRSLGPRLLLVARQ
jgi:4-amino-4-deoxy-L-arabinose transferase-like glycosyltransferase